MTLHELALLKTSKAKDGDILVIKTDAAISSQDLLALSRAIETTGKKLLVLACPADADVALLEADEARALLERIASSKEPQP